MYTPERCQLMHGINSRYKNNKSDAERCRLKSKKPTTTTIIIAIIILNYRYAEHFSQAIKALYNS